MAWRMCNCTDQMNSVSKQSIMVIITIVSNTYSSIENHGSVCQNGVMRNMKFIILNDSRSIHDFIWEQKTKKIICH